MGCIFFLLIGLAVSCAPLQTPPPMPTNTPIPTTETPTPTKIWFPPTPTYTSFPTPTVAISPTINIQPQFGVVILEDDFSDGSKWTQTQGAIGSATVTNNELTIALSQERAYLFSLRSEPYFKDFYAEVTASPSICRGDDEYGILFRVSPSFDFYRFSLTCNGQTRLDKYYHGTASSPQPPIYSSEVPPGAPSISRLGIWVSGKEMQFFINNVYQFSVHDPSITQGTLGFFARAAGEGAVTINFTDLIVYDVNR